ncbi:MAG: fatty acyl-AMP ligase [Acidobacteriota bacterium]
MASHHSELAAASTMVDVLRYRAHHDPEGLAFRFVPSRGGEVEVLGYGELERKARAASAALIERGMAGQPILLLYPQGLKFVVALMACFYAGAVAVVGYPPRNRRLIPRIESMIRDSGARWLLASRANLDSIQEMIEQGTSSVEVMCCDDLPTEPAEIAPPQWDADQLAVLQYTSGSIAEPKGVMLSHAQILANLRIIDADLQHGPQSHLVSWLPTFHDMGLIYGTLQPIFGGFPCTLMAPTDFLMKPVRWLQAISDYGATHSAAPNFAYDLCTRKVKEAQKAELDLSRWQVAVNGAEPVSSRSLAAFAEAFAVCGFKPQTFCPAYGLAEATLKVTSGRSGEPPRVLELDAESLRNRRIERVWVDASAGAGERRSVVSCGRPLDGVDVAVVEPATRRPLNEGELGEVWVRGESVALGYWQRADVSQATFQARLADGEGPFLRTGDLGFLDGGELFLVGRHKDLIIIGGRNHYPQDIEKTVEACHPGVLDAAVAAFSIDSDEGEKLVIVAELHRSFRRASQAQLAEVRAAVRQAVATEHDVQVYETVLIRTGTLPKTSSGKIQRQRCRADFLAGGLEQLENRLHVG